MTISKQLLISFLIVGLGAVTIVGFFFYESSRKALLERAFAQLTSVKALKKKKIEEVFSKLSEQAKQLAANSDLEQRLRNNERAIDLSQTIENVVYLDKLRNIRFSRRPLRDSTFVKSMKPNSFSDLQTDSLSRHPFFSILAPTQSGFILITQSFEVINDILTERSGLGESGESYLVGEDFIMRSNSRFFAEPTLKKLRAETRAVQRALRGETKPIIAKDYRGIEVLSSFAKLNLNGLNWVILSEIDYAEVVVPIEQMRDRMALIAIGISVLIVLISLFTARTISKPILHIQSLIEQVSVGDLPKVESRTASVAEIDKMKIAVKRLIDALERTRAFAIEIGRGNFEAHFEPLGNRDATGTALLKMKAELKRLAKLTEQEQLSRAAALVEGQESERNRISRELHDGVGQILTAIKFQAQSLPESEKRAELLNLLNDALIEVRALSYNLMPRILMDFGLKAAVQKLCNESSKPADVQIHFETNFTDEQRFSQQVEIGVFRIAQEALNNALKYAHATSIRIELLLIESKVSLQIRDNGQGFNREELKHANGLRNMEERAKLLGGACVIRSEKNKGATIKLHLHTPIMNSKQA